jgi:hypothetical protein
MDYVAACYLLGFYALHKGDKGEHMCIWCDCQQSNKHVVEKRLKRTTDDLKRLYAKLDGKIDPKNNHGIKRKALIELPNGYLIYEFVYPDLFMF